jgi:PAS domain S-box-containing protein
VSQPVLLVGPTASGLADQLLRQGLDPVTATSAEAAQTARATQPFTVVIDAEAPDAVEVAQRVGRQSRTLPVILLAGGDLAPVLRSDLHVTPYLSRETRVLDPGRDDLLGAVVEAVGTERRRRRHVRTSQHLAQVQMPAALGSAGLASQYLGQLVEHVPIAVVSVDGEGTIRGWNPRAEAITGRRGRDALGEAFLDLFPPAERAVVRETLDAAQHGAGAVTTTAARPGVDGEEQLLELTVAAMGDGNLGTLVLLDDVTERVRTERELSERARTAGLTAAVALAVAADRPLEDKLDQCARAVIDHLDAAFARVWLLDESADMLVLRASAGQYTHLDGPHSRIPVGELKIGRIAETWRPHLTNEVVGDPNISDQEWARREGMIAFAGYPLISADQLVGVLALFARRALPASALDALSSIADTLAVGIQQAYTAEEVLDLLDRERRAREEAESALDRYVALTRTLQRSLLPPSLPSIAGVEVSARYHWAGAGDTVGGDFYDLFRLSDGRWCAVSGDVSGKGVDAAAITALARYSLRTAGRSCSDPAEAIRTLNEVLLDYDATDRFCTLVAVAFDGTTPEGLDISVACAGHPLPLRVTPSGVVEELCNPGMPVGLFDDIDVASCEARLQPGDALVLYTDGITEARGPEGDFRPDLLPTLLHRTAGRSAGDITAAVEEAIVTFEAGAPRDDLSLLVLRVLPHTP